MIKVTSVGQISAIPAEQWNRLAGVDVPFLRHEFLAALEQSGAVSAANGWHPHHLKIEQGGEIVALMPLYLKDHSRGEYVFDQGWADAFCRNGLNYYPKWLTAIPFTPCQGSKILLKPTVDREPVYAAILQFFQQQSAGNDAATWHSLFLEPDEQQRLSAMGLLIRQDVQFKWHNRDYGDFDDFLQQLSARKRKSIRRERRQIKEQNIDLIRLGGEEVSDQQWQVFYDFYSMTYRKYGRHPYLNHSFFKRIAEQMPEQLLLTMAIKEGRYVGAALSLLGGDKLYGRYWGCHEEYNFLHFEACYYQGIEYCIENGLKQFDSGAQGEHKISRGFEPVITASAHWIKEPRFRQAIEKFVLAEKEQVAVYQDRAAERLPFKQS